jgi:transposase
MTAKAGKIRAAGAAAYLAGKGTLKAVAAEYGLTLSNLDGAVRLARRKAGIKAQSQRRFGTKEEAVVRDYLKAHPATTLLDLRAHLLAETGTKISKSALGRTLVRMGLKHVKPTPTERKKPDKVAQRYGYGPRHRRPVRRDCYPSSSNDTEWALIRDLFEHQGTGRPPVHSRRTMFDAIQYVQRSGCAWRMLPKDFPPWSAVYAVFRRWTKNGLFERMQGRLRAIAREQLDRAVAPSAAIVDSQSVKTAEKGGPSVMTRVRRSRAASVTL